MSSKATIIASCWFAVAVISSVYIWVALGGGYLGDILFGLLLPIGALVLVAFVVTFGVQGGFESENKSNNMLSIEFQEIRSKLDEVAKEVEAIKKAIED
jgi:outer membrane murein-binding lipoprotein Lpp